MVFQYHSVYVDHLNLPACNIIQGRYKYMADLRALESKIPLCSPVIGSHTSSTPLKPQVWVPYLAQHPDQDLGKYIWRGITEG